jgi:hypothetical protein
MDGLSFCNDSPRSGKSAWRPLHRPEPDTAEFARQEHGELTPTWSSHLRFPSVRPRYLGYRAEASQVGVEA